MLKSFFGGIGLSLPHMVRLTSNKLKLLYCKVEVVARRLCSDCRQVIIIIIIIIKFVQEVHHKTNKCIGDDTKAVARQSLNCIKNKIINKI